MSKHRQRCLVRFRFRRLAGGVTVCRKAFTLIELLVTMAAFSAIFAVTVLMLHGLRHTSAKMGQRLEQGAQVQRFTMQLRMDVHGAWAAESLPAEANAQSGPRLRLTLADSHTVEYELFDDRVERQERQGEELVRQETYYVLPVLATGWTLDEARGHPLVSVHVRNSMTTNDEPALQLPPRRVDAVVGLSGAPRTEGPVEGSTS
jgi:prepilin-type N-terminal cleavage/methylation domain-containing protein